MRYATAADLDQLEALLAAIRQREGMVERQRGIFYRRGRALLHFHAHQGELLADLRADEGFARFVLAGAGADALLQALDERLAAGD